MARGDNLQGVNVAKSEEEPADQAFAITPHDTNKLTATTRGIYVGGVGNVVVDMATTGTDISFVAVPAGTILPIRAIRVKTTSTATSMVALY